MKDKFDLDKYYTFDRSDWDAEVFFSSNNLQEIEDDISHLRTLSMFEHRKLARKIYSKLRARMASISDPNEKMKLQNLAHLIKMKVKEV